MSDVKTRLLNAANEIKNIIDKNCYTGGLTTGNITVSNVKIDVSIVRNFFNVADEIYFNLNDEARHSLKWHTYRNSISLPNSGNVTIDCSPYKRNNRNENFLYACRDCGDSFVKMANEIASVI